jgi:hypothetical protein
MRLKQKPLILHSGAFVLIKRAILGYFELFRKSILRGMGIKKGQPLFALRSPLTL